MTIIDGAERGRPGRTLVDYYDCAGKRRLKTYKTRKEAEDFVTQQEELQRTSDRAIVNPDITIQDYLSNCLIIWREEQGLEDSTITGYEGLFRDHILPELGRRRVREITRQDILELKSHLSTQPALGCTKTPLKNGRLLSKGTIRRIINTLSGMFSFAIDDGIRPDNPAARMGRRKNTRTPPEERIKPIELCKALTKKERDRVFLAAFEMVDLRYYLFLYLLAATGMRPGEARALRWRHLDLEGTQELHDGVPMITVEYTFKKKGQLGAPKNKKTREVEVELSLCALFRTFQAIRQPHPEDFIFSDRNPQTALTEKALNMPWPFVLAMAGIPRWLSPYCLRHTYASILIREGVSPSFICEQLGHANTAVTEKYYAKWLPRKSFGALGKLGLARIAVAAPVTGLVQVAEGARATH